MKETSSSPETFCDQQAPFILWHGRTPCLVFSAGVEAAGWGIERTLHLASTDMTSADSISHQLVICAHLIGHITRVGGPCWGNALASAGLVIYAGNHCGMPCTIDLSRLHQ